MDVPCEMLLHPELLSNQQLIYVIQARQLKIPNMECMTRDHLLELFHHYCVPYGQRKYRDSGRGKLLNKIRHTSPETKPKLEVISHVHNRKLLNLSNHERLKPPPDLLSGHMKRIKLENNQKMYSSNNANINKRKMSVDLEQPQTYVPPQKKEKKPITWP